MVAPLGNNNTVTIHLDTTAARFKTVYKPEPSMTRLDLSTARNMTKESKEEAGCLTRFFCFPCRSKKNKIAKDKILSHIETAQKFQKELNKRSSTYLALSSDEIGELYAKLDSISTNFESLVSNLKNTYLTDEQKGNFISAARVEMSRNHDRIDVILSTFTPNESSDDDSANPE